MNNNARFSLKTAGPVGRIGFWTAKSQPHTLCRPQRLCRVTADTLQSALLGDRPADSRIAYTVPLHPLV